MENSRAKCFAINQALFIESLHLIVNPTNKPCGSRFCNKAVDTNTHIMDLFSDTAAILNHIVSNSYYGILRRQILFTNLLSDSIMLSYLKQ